MASTTPARKAVKTSQLPNSLTSSQSDAAVQGQDGDPQASVYTVAMTAINFVAFLFSLLAVDVHYTIRRSAFSAAGAPEQGILPRWLHSILHPFEPYETYYRTKQKKLMRMEAEEAFRLRNRTLALLAASALGMALGVWYLAGRAYHKLFRVDDR